MKEIAIADARDNLSALIEDAETDPIVLTRRGKPVAMLIGIDEYRTNKSLYEAMEELRKENKQAGEALDQWAELVSEARQ